MNTFCGTSWGLVGGLLAWGAFGAFSQSLSLVREGPQGYRFKVSAPSDTRWVLRASANLHLWVDLQDEVTDGCSYGMGETSGPRRFYQLAPVSPPAPFLRIVLVGDSTASECCGWGQGLAPYFRPNAQVINFAMAWHSTRMFLVSEEKDKLLLIRPDVVLAQFGYMDTESLEFGRGTTLVEFEQNLRSIVALIRGFGGVPILVTPSASMMWIEGRVPPAWANRCEIVTKIADELGTERIDLNRLTRELYQELGEDAVAPMRFQPGDAVHLSPRGAQLVARLAVNALPNRFGPYLVGDIDRPTRP